MLKIILVAMVFTLAACGENSNKSSNSASGNTVVEGASAGETSDFGFITDTNLRACLDESGMTVKSIHTIVCAGKGVQSLEGMDQLTSLKNLNVSHNQLSDLTPLTNVKSLQVFYATNNDIESIEALNALPELNAISLRSNNLTDADIFYTLPQLAKLYVQGNEELSLDMSKLSADVIVAI